MYNLIYYIFSLVIGLNYTGRDQQCSVVGSKNLELSLSLENSTTFSLSRTYINTTSDIKKIDVYRGIYNLSDSILILNIQSPQIDMLIFESHGDTMIVNDFNLITCHQGLRIKKLVAQ